MGKEQKSGYVVPLKEGTNSCADLAFAEIANKDRVVTIKKRTTSHTDEERVAYKKYLEEQLNR